MERMLGSLSGKNVLLPCPAIPREAASQAFAPISQRTKRLIMLAQVSSQVGGQ
jgi:hypothetical protein